MNAKSRYHAAGMLAAFAGLAAASLEAATWNNATGGTTPDTAMDWTLAGNWLNDEKPSHNGTAEVLQAISTGRFISLPDDLGLYSLKIGERWYLLGKTVTFGSGADAAALRGDDGYLYADVVSDSSPYGLYAGSTKNGYCLNICGRICDTPGHAFLLAGGIVYHQLARYADASGEVRTGDYQTTQTFVISDTSLTVFGPYGADRQSGTWSQTEGSPFLTRVANPVNTICVGGLVKGRGIPDGAYVKRYFNNLYCELSVPASETIAANAITFEPFSPKVRAYVPALQRQGSQDKTLAVVKYREQDDVRFETGLFKMMSNSSAMIQVLGIPDSYMPGMLPGTIVFHEVTGRTSSFELLNCHLELAGTSDGGPTEFQDYLPFSFRSSATASTVARFTVTNGVEGVIRRFGTVNSILCKNGSGTLQIGLDSAANAGTIKVEGGTLKLVKNSGVGAVTLHRLEIAAGATFEAPAEGLTVEELVASEGACVTGGPVSIPAGSTAEYEQEPEAGGAALVVAVSGIQYDIAGNNAYVIDAVTGSGAFTKSGEGRAVLRSTSGCALVVKGGELLVNSLSLDNSSVPTGVWFHGDAADTNTFSLIKSGDNLIATRWNDAAGSGGRFEWLFQHGSYPYLRLETLNGLPVVDMNVQLAGDRAALVRGMGYVKPNGTRYTHQYVAGQGYIDSPDVFSAFFVFGSRNGGGALLGGYGGGYPYQGFPHNPASWTGEGPAPMLCEDAEFKAFGKVTAAIASGTETFRLNGESFNPLTTPFSGGYDLLTVSGKVAFESDCIGFYGSGETYKDDEWRFNGTANGLEYAEFLLYTNELSEADIKRTEAYLQKKWFNRDYDGVDPYCTKFASSDVRVESGARLTVVGAGDATVAGLSGSGVIDATSVTVEAGGILSPKVLPSGRIEGPLQINCAVDLSAGGRIVLSGPVKPLPGIYEILTAESLIPGVWAAEASWRGYTCKARFTGNKLVLNVYGPGTRIMFR